MGEEKTAQERRKAESRSFLFRGPTVVAALVCAVSAVFSVAVGAALVSAPSALEGTLLVSLSNGNPPPQGLLNAVGGVMLLLAFAYVVSAGLLWSEVHWI